MNQTAPAETATTVGAGREAQGPSLVPGTMIVAFLMASGRWGSYLGWPERSIFVTEIGLLASCVWLVVRHLRSLRLPRRRLLALLPLCALLAWTLLRLIAGGPPTQTVLRDAAPFGYGAVALAAALRLRADAYARTLVVIAVALVVHAVWVTISLFMPTLWPPLPVLGDKVVVFELRSDFDGAMLAVLAGLALREVLRTSSLRRRLLAVAFVLWPIYAILQIGNRAGLLALLAALFVVLGAERRTLARIPRRYLGAAALLIVAAAVLVIPQTNLYGRLTGDPQFEQNSVEGTTSARQQAWSAVLDYMDEDAARTMTGVGFGPNYLVPSGARPFFGEVHRGDIRAPHNGLLNTYARLGVIGLALFGWLLWRWLRAGARTFRRAGRHDVTGQREVGDGMAMAAALISVTLLVTSLVGVILESPFGAVPFFWGLGVLVAGHMPESQPVPWDEEQAVA